MTISKVSLARGDFEIKLGEETIILSGRFENIDRLERYLDIGVYEFSNRMMSDKIKFGEIAAILYCFCDQRDQEGYSYIELGEKLRQHGMWEVMPFLQKFWQIMFAIDEMEELESELVKQEPRNRQERKALESKKKKAVKKKIKKTVKQE